MRALVHPVQYTCKSGGNAEPENDGPKKEKPMFALGRLTALTREQVETLPFFVFFESQHFASKPVKKPASNNDPAFCKQY